MSQPRVRGLRSKTTKAKPHIDRVRAANAELEKKLAEALEQQAATSEVLQVIASSPGELEPVFQAMLANATRICEASYGTLWLCEGSGFRAVALHGALPSAFTEQLRDGRIWYPSEAVAITRVARTLQTVQVDDLSADQGYAAGLPKRCSAHGLRKAACRRLAEAGCSANEIMSISGHTTMKEIVRYTVAADQARLARNAMTRTAKAM
jgi:hypothetical protein